MNVSSAFGPGLWRWGALLFACVGCNLDAVATNVSSDGDAGMRNETEGRSDEQQPTAVSATPSEPSDVDSAMTLAGDASILGPGATSTPLPDTSGLPTSASLPSSDASSDEQAELAPDEPAVICPSAYKGRAKTPVLYATDGEQAAFVFSSGEEQRAPFAARFAVEVWGEHHFALFNPTTAWDVVVVSHDGSSEHHASGEFSQFHDNFRTRDLRLDDDGTLTADYSYEGHDWTSSGAVRDLIVPAEGAARESVIADVDEYGFTPYEYGLADTKTGSLREVPDRGTPLSHVQRDGRWLGAYLVSRDGNLEMVLIDAEQTRSFALGPDVVAPRRLVAVGDDALVVLQQFGEGIPVLRFDLATEAATQLIDPNAAAGLIGVQAGNSYVALDSSQRTARWLADVETGITVELSALGSTQGSVVTGARSWFVIEDGVLVAKVSRASGAQTTASDLAGTGRVWPLQDRLLFMLDGVLSASLDLATEEWSSLETSDVDVDELIGFADWVVGTRAGLPVLRLAADSTLSETIEPVTSNGPVSHQVFDDWLLFTEAGRPLLAMSRDGSLSTFDDDDALPEADTITVAGDWAFGFAATEGDSAVTYTIVWRVNLAEASTEVVSEPPEYEHLFAARYFERDAGVLAASPGPLLPTDRGHADGWVTALRRDASSSRVLGYGPDSEWHAIGDPMPLAFNVNVTRGDGFFVIEQASWNCFCPPPDLAWEPTDAPAAPWRQLVLTASQPFLIFRHEAEFEGTLSIHPNAPCVAWSDALAAFAFDGQSGERVALAPGMNWRWLNPK
jgi:hypothetical protein